ncbi:hypothetical protein BpHYR1_005609 [Brachionus plicatilis]|uniref:Uncharacterized protein n=1 Tax=Brachionus plicatilis TaxID=10195 RepID=A0A3M7PXA4_BRAPC|nr:hypothetical protein BpHYR1_005609 [Brachionus plicatilis]
MFNRSKTDGQDFLKDRSFKTVQKRPSEMIGLLDRLFENDWSYLKGLFRTKKEDFMSDKQTEDLIQI